MMKLTKIALSLALCGAGVTLHAGEKKLMHCFAYTAVQNASDADWQAFYKATDALPGKIPGVSKVWYGKLQRPLGIFNPTNIDDATRKKLTAGSKATVEIERLPRQYGVCMEMADEAALKAYETAPYHKVWADAYSKVRVEGTTTYNILGQ